MVDYAAGFAADEPHVQLGLPCSSSPPGVCRSSGQIGPFSFATWNCRSLFGGCRQPRVHLARKQVILRLFYSHDAVGLQEIRGSISDITIWESELREHKVFATHCAGGAGGGVACILKDRFINRCADIWHRPIVPGRVLQVMMTGEGLNINLIVIHIDPMLNDMAKKHIFKQIKSTMNILVRTRGHMETSRSPSGSRRRSPISSSFAKRSSHTSR